MCSSVFKWLLKYETLFWKIKFVFADESTLSPKSVPSIKAFNISPYIFCRFETLEMPNEVRKYLWIPAIKVKEFTRFKRRFKHQYLLNFPHTKFIITLIYKFIFSWEFHPWVLYSKHCQPFLPLALMFSQLFLKFMTSSFLMCLCECLYIYLCMCVYIRIYMCLYMSVYICRYVHIYVCVFVWVYMYACAYVCMYVCIYVCVYVSCWSHLAMSLWAFV
jgi:nuclear pore complex protein Nup62